MGIYTDPRLSQRLHKRTMGTLVFCLQPGVDFARQIWHRIQCHEGVNVAVIGGSNTSLATGDICPKAAVSEVPSALIAHIVWFRSLVNLDFFFLIYQYNIACCAFKLTLCQLFIQNILFPATAFVFFKPFLYFQSLVHPFHTLPFEILSSLYSGQHQDPT